MSKATGAMRKHESHALTRRKAEIDTTLPAWKTYSASYLARNVLLGLLIGFAESNFARGERKGPYCAKLHHSNGKRCIFRHWGPDPTMPAR